MTRHLSAPVVVVAVEVSSLAMSLHFSTMLIWLAGFGGGRGGGFGGGRGGGGYGM